MIISYCKGTEMVVFRGRSFWKVQFLSKNMTTVVLRKKEENAILIIYHYKKVENAM